MRIPPHVQRQIEFAQQQVAEAEKAGEIACALADKANAERYQDFLKKYPDTRAGDISRALSRRICAGDAGMPFAIIETLVASAVTGHEKGKAADIDAAIESVKDRLWFQCRHLGGDAVFFTRFSFERGIASFTNYGAATFNFISAMVGAVVRGGLGAMDSKDQQTTTSVVAQGTAVKLFPSGTQVSP